MLWISIILSGTLLALAAPLSLVPVTIPLPFGDIVFELPGMENGAGYLQYSWLAFIGLVPAIYAWGRARTPLLAAILGYSTGLVWMVLHLTWIESFGWAPVFLLSLFFSLPYALVAVFVRAAVADGRLGMIQWGLPAIWAGIEYIKTFGVWAYPWNILGYSQAPEPSILQIADLGGVFLISFVIIAVNSSVYLLLGGSGKFRYRLGHALTGFALLTACVAYGHARLNMPAPTERLMSYRLGLVQGGMQTLDSWEHRDLDSTLDLYISPTTDLLDELEAIEPEAESGVAGPPLPDAVLVAWPESVLPRRMSPRHPERVPQRLISLIQGRDHSALLLGTLGRPNSEELNENGAMVIRGGVELDWASSKVRPVPFGEVVPFRDAVRFLPFPWGSYNLDAGMELDPLEWRGRSIGTLICFDNVFPFVSRQQALNGAGSFILMTNNSWYDLHSGIRQHCDMDILRAVETRRPLARVSTTGWSQVIDSYGRIQQQTGIDTFGTIQTEMLPSAAASVYLVVGDLFAQLCVIAGALSMLVTLVPGKSEGIL